MGEQPIRLYGYIDERGRIEKAIEDNQSLCFLCIDGVGGIGKTTMLRAIHDKYSQDDAYCTTPIMDFDELQLHIVQNVLQKIACSLSTPEITFEAFSQAYNHLREIQRQGAGSLRVEGQEAQTRDAFIRDFQRLAAQRPVILFFDTVEKVQDLAQWRDLLDVLLRLEKAIIVLAGRQNEAAGATIKDQLGGRPGSVHVIPLGGLSADASWDYFSRTTRGKYLASEDAEQSRWVCHLCDGRPILLDLAVDWLSRGTNLAIPEQPKAKLADEELKQLKRDFERGLVQQVSQLAAPENEAVLDMAHVYHYFDAERHTYIHPEFSLQRSQELLDSLRSFSFVKPQPGGGMRLHDEMQRMVQEHVWPWLDPKKTRRCRISEQMIQFYEMRLKLEQNKASGQDEAVLQALTTEQLYHYLYADIKRGHQVFQPLFLEALKRYQRDLARVLLKTFVDFAKDFDDVLAAWAAVHQGRLLRADERVQEAVDYIRPAKQKLQALGVHAAMDTVCNALGYCQRLLGNWEQAIAAYEEALGYSMEEHDGRQMAETMNNIANVSRLSGDFERANRYSLVGLKIREKLGDQQGIAYSCYVRGMVTWETGNSAEAAQYLERARRIFEEIGADEGIAETQKYQSYLRFRTGNLERALELLREAKKTFAERESGLGLADCLNLEARILIDSYAASGESDEHFCEVEQLAQQALHLAQRIHDSYKIAECNLTLCRNYYRWGRFHHDRDKEQAQFYYGLARQKYDGLEGGHLARQRNYLGPASVYEWVMGDIAFANKDWKTAFQHYIAELEISCRFKDARYARALNSLSERFHTLAFQEADGRSLARQYCDYVIAGWKERNLASQHPEVVEECEYVKRSLALVDPHQVAGMRQRGEDLLAQGEWQRAIDVFAQLAAAEQTYSPDETVADAMTQSARAYRQLGEYVLARRACQQGLLIRMQMRKPGPHAASRLVMGTIMWTTGNTSEAARHYRLAQELFTAAGDEVGQARTNRHAAFMRHHIGDRREAYELAERSAATFRRHKLLAELADVTNLLGMMALRENRHADARVCAEEAQHLAQMSGAQYSLAEARLTLLRVEYFEGRQAWEAAGKPAHIGPFFAKAWACYHAGYAVAVEHGYLLLQSVYQSTAGFIAFDEDDYAAAFAHFARDLDCGARFTISRMRRELDQIVNRYVRLPQGLRRFYADYLINEWRTTGRAEAEPDVTRLFQLLKEYDAYV